MSELEPEIRKEVARLKRELGPQHQDTLNAQNNLAVICWRRGKFRESETMQRKVLNSMRSTLGEHHSDTVTVRDNLAISLRQRGRSAEADELALKSHIPHWPAAVATALLMACCVI